MAQWPHCNPLRVPMATKSSASRLIGITLRDAEAIAFRTDVAPPPPPETTGASLAPPTASGTTSRSDDGPADHRYRTIWLSDIHLGSGGCQAHYLLDFLRHNDSEYLYLVGDIIDGWQLRKGWFWPQAHNDVIQKVLRKARKGTQVVYIPGNHDEAARHYVGVDFGGVALRYESSQLTSTGRAL